MDLKELPCRAESSRKHEYGHCEKFPEGSSPWRSSISGLETTRLRLQELTQRSENRLYAINLTTLEVLALNSECNAPGFRAPSRTERRSKSQCALVTKLLSHGRCRRGCSREAPIFGNWESLFFLLPISATYRDVAAQRCCVLRVIWQFPCRSPSQRRAKSLRLRLRPGPADGRQEGIAIHRFGSFRLF